LFCSIVNERPPEDVLSDERSKTKKRHFVKVRLGKPFHMRNCVGQLSVTSTIARRKTCCLTRGNTKNDNKRDLLWLAVRGVPKGALRTHSA